MSKVGGLLSKKDVATIEEMFATAVRLVRAGDWAGWAALYAKDAVLHPPNLAAIRGWAAIHKWGVAFPPVEAIAFSNVQVSGEGNLAYGTSRFKLRTRGLPTDTGKQLIVLRRGTSGWAVVAASFNSDLALPGQAQ